MVPTRTVQLGEMNMIDLHTFYLSAISAVAENEGFETVLQQLERGACRLLFIPEKSTRADVVLNVVFDTNEVRFEVQMRNGHKEATVFRYVQGIDEFLGGLVRALRAGRLEAPKTATGRRAA